MIPVRQAKHFGKEYGLIINPKILAVIGKAINEDLDEYGSCFVLSEEDIILEVWVGESFTARPNDLYFRIWPRG